MSESSQDIDLAILTALLKGNDLQHTQIFMIICIIEPSPVEMSQAGIMWSAYDPGREREVVHKGLVVVLQLE